MTNINADVLAINSVRGDEYFTLEKDVRTIADNLIPGLNIWCPFDTEESHFPHVLREDGHHGAGCFPLVDGGRRSARTDGN